MALLAQKEFIVNALDKKMVTLEVFIDFSKATDQVNHILLLKKISIYGIPGWSGALIQSYNYDSSA